MVGLGLYETAHHYIPGFAYQQAAGDNKPDIVSVAVHYATAYGIHLRWWGSRCTTNTHDDDDDYDCTSLTVVNNCLFVL